MSEWQLHGLFSPEIEIILFVTEVKLLFKHLKIAGKNFDVFTKC